MGNEINYRVEHDLYQDCIERVARKIEAYGEEALALALKEFGFEKVVRCMDCKFCMAYMAGTYCDYMAHAIELNGFCAWGERKAVEQ